MEARIVVVDYTKELAAWYRIFEWFEKSYVRVFLKPDLEQI